MQVDNIVKRWASVHECLPSLFLFCDNLDDLDDRARVDWPKAVMNSKPGFLGSITGDDILFIDREVRGNRIRGVNRFIRLTSGACECSPFENRDREPYVASFPAYLRMILLPPGCSKEVFRRKWEKIEEEILPSRNSVTSYTFPNIGEEVSPIQGSVVIG